MDTSRGESEDPEVQRVWMNTFAGIPILSERFCASSWNLSQSRGKKDHGSLAIAVENRVSRVVGEKISAFTLAISPVGGHA